jgi:hypothetical protein
VLLGLSLLTTALAMPPPTQVVRMEVVAEWAPRNLSLDAETVWLGQSLVANFRDDGRPPDARREDGVWTASWTGDPVRQLPIQIYYQVDGGVRSELSATVETLSFPEDRLIWVLTASPRPQAHRVAAALPTRSLRMSEVTSIAAGFGWMGLLLLYVGWLLQRPHDAPGSRDDARP